MPPRFIAPLSALAVILAGASFISPFISEAASPSSPAFTSDNRLIFPADYREWIFLSAGRGMTYGPAANPNGPPLFDNVFVHPAAYKEFSKTGRWPDKSVFVLEIRSAATEGSINKGGQFQRNLVAVEVEVKDQKRFPESNGWGFFDFGKAQEPAKILPKTAECYSCHSQNAAVEQTFVQFYPTLIDVARAHGTFKEAASADTPKK